MFQKVFILILVVTSFLLYSCKNEEEPQNVGSRAYANKRVATVCIVDEASLRNGPSAKADWISSIALGERITWLGISEIDSTKETREYYKVELSDSSTGWTTAYALELRADPAVIVQRASIFRRPDLITVTDAEFEPMNFVALLETDTDWLKVVGENRRKKGWVKRAAVSLKEEDIAVGVLTSKIIKDKNKEKRMQRLEDLIENPAFINSVFIKDVAVLLNEENDKGDRRSSRSIGKD